MNQQCAEDPCTANASPDDVLDAAYTWLTKHHDDADLHGPIPDADEAVKHLGLTEASLSIA